MPETLLPDGRPDVSLMLLRMLGILTFGTDADIGLDPHCEVNDFTARLRQLQLTKPVSKLRKRFILLTPWLVEALKFGL